MKVEKKSELIGRGGVYRRPVCLAPIDFLKMPAQLSRHLNMKSATAMIQLVGSLKMNTTLEYSTRVVQEGDRRCKKSTLNDLAYLTPLRIPLMNPVSIYVL
jgi:hypothetical protein